MQGPPDPARRPWRRPPWWPADQPWPPRGRGPRHGPPGFVLRLGCVLAVVVALAAIGLGALAAALSGGRPGGGWFHPWPPFFLLLLIAALVIGVRSLRRVVTPLSGLVSAAGRVEAGDYTAQVQERGSPELRSVARAFNAMTARLRENEARRRTFLADVTHELRTPLAVIRGQAEAIADGVYPGDAEHVAPIIEAARALEVLTEDLRTLALSESGALGLAREHVDLAALADHAVAAFRTQAEAAGVTLTAEAAGGVPPADVDPARISAVVGNLLANALRHTPAGGAIRVTVRRSGDGVQLSVADTGTGIPPQMLPHVFDRFVRGPGSTGSGLGLAIALDVVYAHGGTISIESPPGVGTTVTLDLPRA